MNNDFILKINNLEKTYKSESETLTILKDLSMNVRRGSKCVIVGQSGSGKSTLLNIIGGLDKATSGEVLIDDYNITSLNEKELTKLRQNLYGFIFQFHYLLKDFTALENVYLPLYMKGESKKIAIEKAKHLLNEVGLAERFNHIPSQLSGGERQRISIARAILNDPRLLILDEATSALDTESEFLIQQALNRLIKGRTTFAIAHRLSTLREADRLVVIDKHSIAEMGSHNELLEKKGIYYGLVTAQLKMAEC